MIDPSLDDLIRASWPDVDAALKRPISHFAYHATSDRRQAKAHLTRVLYSADRPYNVGKNAAKRAAKGK